MQITGMKMMTTLVGVLIASALSAGLAQAMSVSGISSSYTVGDTVTFHAEGTVGESGGNGGTTTTYPDCKFVYNKHYDGPLSSDDDGNTGVNSGKIYNIKNGTVLKLDSSFAVTSSMLDGKSEDSGEFQIHIYCSCPSGGCSGGYGYWSGPWATKTWVAKKPAAACSSGSCCDTSNGSYYSSSKACDDDVDVEYACNDGTNPGNDVYVRYKSQYCSGLSSSCNGGTSWGSWKVTDYCSDAEICVPDQSTCQILTGCQYNNPACDSNHDCVNNSCVLKTGCQYGNPACGSGYTCSNNQCVLSCSSSADTIGIVSGSITYTSGLLKFSVNLYNGQCSNSLAKFKVWIDGAYDGQYNLSPPLASKTSKTYPVDAWDAGALTVGVHKLKVCIGDTTTCSEADFNVYSNQCTSGACCDTTWKTYKSSTVVCNSNVETIYECPDGTSAGSDIYTKNKIQYCSGSSATCSGTYSWSSLVKKADCGPSEKCVTGNPSCQPMTGCQYNNPPCSAGNTCINNQCVKSVQCTGGVCCNITTKQFKPSATVCKTNIHTEFGCPYGETAVYAKFFDQYCSGTSGTCNGEKKWSDWTETQDCAATTKCAAGSPICISKLAACYKDSDCLTAANTSYSYCKATDSNSVYKGYEVFSCVNPGTENAYCKSTIEVKPVNYCPLTTCSGGSCNPYCSVGKQVGTDGYCSHVCPCRVAEGHCDSDEECRGGLKCLAGGGLLYGFGEDVGVCVEPVPVDTVFPIVEAADYLLIGSIVKDSMTIYDFENSNYRLVSYLDNTHKLDNMAAAIGDPELKKAIGKGNQPHINHVLHYGYGGETVKPFDLHVQVLPVQDAKSGTLVKKYYLWDSKSNTIKIIVDNLDEVQLTTKEMIESVVNSKIPKTKWVETWDKLKFVVKTEGAAGMFWNFFNKFDLIIVIPELNQALCEIVTTGDDSDCLLYGGSQF